MASKTQKGFTIIEVILFLAVSGAIVAGIIATTSGTLSHRRYDDSVQDFVSHLREIYSDALNTQLEITDSNINLPCSESSEAKKMGNGRSDCVVYGVIATIDNKNGEVRIQTSKLVGKEYDKDTMEDSRGFVILPSSASSMAAYGDKRDPVKRLAAADTVIGFNDPSGNATAISGKVYRGRWGISIDNASTKVSDGIHAGDESSPASIIIFRDPKEGNLISRLASGMPYNLVFDSEDRNRSRSYNFGNYDNVYERFVLFKDEALYFCVTPGTGETSSHRRLIRIDPFITNESAVQLIDSEDERYEGVCD